MRTGRSLTVCCSVLPGGGVGGCLLPGGCLLWGGVCLLWRECLLPGGCIPACTEANTLPPCGQNSWHTLVKILPWPNFVAAGNNAWSLLMRQLFVEVYCDALADPKGGARDVRLPWGLYSFIFMQFSAKKLQNNRLAHPFWKLAPPGKPWIHHCQNSLWKNLLAHLVQLARVGKILLTYWIQVRNG